MAIAPKALEKCLKRFDELIDRGAQINVLLKTVHRHSTPNFARREMAASNSYQTEGIDAPAFFTWRTQCVTLLDRVVPSGSIHRAMVESFNTLPAGVSQRDWGMAQMRAIREEVELGLLDSLSDEVESEVAADYMGQAERLLEEGSSGKWDHVPAAVLAGATFERALKMMCERLRVPTTTEQGAPAKLNTMIDALKKRQVYNETRAKQLRGWASIRNHAAHGEFEEFTREQVRGMLMGLNEFLAVDWGRADV